MSRKGMTAARAERAAKVVALHTAGATFEKIGKQLNISTQQAWRDYEAAMKEARPQSTKLIFKKMERRIEELHLHYWKAALDGDLKAAQFCLKLIQELGDLHGLRNGTVRVEMEDTQQSREWADLLTSIRRHHEERADADNE